MDILLIIINIVLDTVLRYKYNIFFVITSYV